MVWRGASAWQAGRAGSQLNVSGGVHKDGHIALGHVLFNAVAQVQHVVALGVGVVGGGQGQRRVRWPWAGEGAIEGRVGGWVGG